MRFKNEILAGLSVFFAWVLMGQKGEAKPPSGGGGPPPIEPGLDLYWFIETYREFTIEGIGSTYDTIHGYRAIHSNGTMFTDTTVQGLRNKIDAYWKGQQVPSPTGEVWTCSVCGKTFTNFQDYQVHVVTHYGYEPPPPETLPPFVEWLWMENYRGFEIYRMSDNSSYRADWGGAQYFIGSSVYQVRAAIDNIYATQGVP